MWNFDDVYSGSAQGLNQYNLKAGVIIAHVLEPFFFRLSANMWKYTLNYLVKGNKVALPTSQ